MKIFKIIKIMLYTIFSILFLFILFTLIVKFEISKIDCKDIKIQPIKNFNPNNYFFRFSKFHIKNKKIFFRVDALEFNVETKCVPKTFHDLLLYSKRLKNAFIVDSVCFKEPKNDIVMEINHLYQKKFSKIKLYHRLLFDFFYRTKIPSFVVETMLDKDKKLLGFKLYDKSGKTFFYNKNMRLIAFIDKNGKIHPVNLLADNEIEKKEIDWNELIRRLLKSSKSNPSFPDNDIDKMQNFFMNQIFKKNVRIK